METSQPKPSSSYNSAFLSMLLVLCIIYIGASTIRGCSRDKELDMLKKESKSYSSVLDSLQKALLNAQKALSDNSNNGGQNKGKNSNKNASTEQPLLFGSEIGDKGAYFEVQIGAFQFFDLRKYRPGFIGGMKEEYDQDLDKYTIAKFRNYTEADAFKRDMVRLGIDDAWIVGKIDGKRTDINTVMKAAKK